MAVHSFRGLLPTAVLSFLLSQTSLGENFDTRNHSQHHVAQHTHPKESSMWVFRVSLSHISFGLTVIVGKDASSVGINHGRNGGANGEFQGTGQSKDTDRGKGFKNVLMSSLHGIKGFGVFRRALGIQIGQSVSFFHFLLAILFGQFHVLVTSFAHFHTHGERVKSHANQYQGCGRKQGTETGRPGRLQTWTVLGLDKGADSGRRETFNHESSCHGCLLLDVVNIG
mmetsp:Transcript_17363/g.35988  ORF Transcript_17363/g.35988 Transcript_17363/m.35988 type:complete len:226 (-) Transcript_17363:29-706(-)